MNVITWNTKKIESGFQFRVYSVEYQKDSKTFKTGVCKTRGIAKRQAQKLARYIKSKQLAA